MAQKISEIISEQLAALDAEYAVTKINQYVVRIQNAPVNVKEFGAKGDGVTDDTAAIQTAIDTVADAGGGIINIGNDGDIYLVNNIQLKSNICFIGMGILKALQDGSKIMTGSGINNVLFEGPIIFDGNGSIQTSSTQKMIEFVNSSNISFIGCRFTNSKWLVTIFEDSENILVSKCRFYDTLGNSIVFLSSHDAVVSDNLFYNIGGPGTSGNRAGSAVNINNDGTSGSPSYNIIITGNKINNTTDTAIYVGSDNDNSYLVSVIGNTIFNCGKTAININGGCTDVTVTGNVGVNIGQVGVGISPGVSANISKRIAISNNTFRNIGYDFEIKPGINSLTNNPYGIIIDKAAQCVITGNVIEDVNKVGTSYGYGIYIRRSMEIQFTNNNIYDIENQAILLGDVSRSKINGNVIGNPVGVGISLGPYNGVDSFDTEIAYNTLYDDRATKQMTYGIRIYTGVNGAIVKGNKIKSADVLNNVFTDASTYANTQWIDNLVDDGIKTVTGRITNVLGYHNVKTIATTITGFSGVLTQGYKLRVIFDGTHTLTHGTAANEIQLLGGVDLTGDAGKHIDLVFYGDHWYEVG